MGPATGIMTPLNVLMFVFVIVTQIIAGSMLPKTQGFTSLAWTVGCLSSYCVSFWMLATLIRQGLPMSLLVPVMAAVIPLVLIIVGVVIYGEAASISQIALLGLACVMIGLASAVG